MPWIGAKITWLTVLLASGMLAIGSFAVDQIVAGLCFLLLAAVAFVADRRSERIRIEMARARRDLPALRHQVRKAVAAGESVVALLRGVGYRHANVRKWIVRQSRERRSVDDGHRDASNRAKP